MYGAPVGKIVLTQSTQIVPTNFHARVFGLNFLSSGTSTSVTLLENGPSGTVVLQEQNTTSLPKTVDYGVNGYEFANGVFVALDAQASRVTVSFRREEIN